MIDFLKILVSALMIYGYAKLCGWKTLNQGAPLFAAVLISLPLTTTIAFIWTHHDGMKNTEIASQSLFIFWLTLASLPMLLVLPAMLRRGFAFYPALGVSIGVMFCFYAVAIGVLRRFGVQMM